jgi:hypothetical protein
MGAANNFLKASKISVHLPGGFRKAAYSYYADFETQFHTTAKVSREIYENSKPICQK